MRNNKYLILSALLSLVAYFLIVVHVNAKSLHPAHKQPIIIKPEISNPYVEYGTDGEMYVNMKIWGKDVAPVKRPPVDLILVIDESGSMHEKGKLTYAKKAAKDLVSRLNSNDNIGIVAYSDYSRVIYPLQRLKNKKQVKRLIDNIYPTNATNLSSGLIEAIKQIKYGNYYFGHDSVRFRNLKIILLSDGLANRGITDIYSLSEISSRASSEGIYITTMGLGLNYDEDLLTSIAEYGAGNYYFIESPRQIAYIFDREFRYMSSTVAKDVVLEIDLNPGVHLSELYGYKYDIVGNKIIIKLGNYFSGQKSNIKFALEVPAKKSGRNKLFSTVLRYQNMEDGKEQTLKDAKEYYVTKNINKVKRNENKQIEADFTSVKAARDLESASREYEMGRKASAVTKIKGALDNLRELNKSDFRSDDTVEQEEVLSEAYKDMSTAPASPSSESGKRIIKKYKSESRLQQK